jgi:hypothetical protein
MKIRIQPNWKIRIVSALIALCAISAFFIFPLPVATLGSWKIYQKDIEYRDNIIRHFFPESTGSQGLRQLQQSALRLFVLEKNGVTVTPEELEAEAKRIDESTRDPEGLAKIKAIFGEDRKGYLKNYVLPGYVDRILQFEFFPIYEKAHELTLKRAQSVIEKTKSNPDVFENVMSQEGITVSTVILSKEKGLHWESRSRDRSVATKDLSLQ